MKFIHIADVHFDIPFTTLTRKSDLGDARRMDQRKVFKKAIEFADEKKVDAIFITGDLYEQECIRKSTIKFINDLFETIPNIEIFMTPGNHDPLIKNSYYKIYNWAKNVHIFGEKLNKYSSEKYDVFGYGFENYELSTNIINEIPKVELNKDDKAKIFISHGDIYTKSQYNFIDIKNLESLGFDYIGLGHIHKRDEYYPGSLISLGFDEPDAHGFIYGEIENNQTKTEFIKVDDKEFKVFDIDVSDVESKEELVEKINSIEINENIFYEINLVGTVNPEKLNLRELNSLQKLLNKNIIKIKNSTKLKFEIRENSSTLSGLYVKILKEKLEKKEITKDEYDKILEIGINCF